MTDREYQKSGPRSRQRAQRDTHKSLFENYEGRCGEGFWPWPRRPWPRAAPAAGCKERANAGHGQKTRRPEGFRGKGRLASLLLSRRSTRDILLRRASPSGLFPENSAPRSFQTGSKLLKRENRRIVKSGNGPSLKSRRSHLLQIKFAATFPSDRSINRFNPFNAP